MTKSKSNQAGKNPRKAQPVGPNIDRRVIPDQADPQSRRRLQKAACEEIAEELQVAGFQAECRSSTVYVWSDSVHVATISWRKGKGWCLMCRQPVTYTRYDLRHLIEEIRRCEAGIVAADQAWEQFKKAKSNKNWAVYQGALAAHFFRLYSGENE